MKPTRKNKRKIPAVTHPHKSNSMPLPEFILALFIMLLVFIFGKTAMTLWQW